MTTVKIGQKPEHGALYVTHRNSTRTGNLINYQFDTSVLYNRIILESATFAQTFNNVSSAYRNNKISFIVDNGATETFTIASGFYDTTGLMTLVMQALNTGHNYFTFSVTNFRITITITAGHTLKFVRFTTANENKLYDMMGFSTSSVIFSTNVNTTVTSNMPVNMNPITQLLLASNQFESQYNVQITDIPFSIPISVEYGHYQTYIRPTDFTTNEIERAYGQQIAIQNLQMYMVNEEFQPLEVPDNFTYCFKFVFVK